MNVKYIFSFALALVVVVVEVSGRTYDDCGCGSPGTSRSYGSSRLYGSSASYESGSAGSSGSYSAQLYEGVPVRAATSPQKISRSKYVQELRPVGDVCSCKHVKIQPAVLPRQKYCLEKKVKPQPCDNRPLVPAPSYLHDFSQDEEEYIDTAFADESSSCGVKKPLYPVDAVSIDLVNRMQQTAAMNIPEEKLQYGFWNLPKELPVQKITTNVPEERLFTVDRQIVELKNPRQVITCGVGPDEEIILENKEPAPVSYLSYSDLGFVPESDSDKKFVSACRNPKPCSGTKTRIIKPDYEDGDYSYKVRRNEEVFVKKPTGCGCN